MSDSKSIGYELGMRRVDPDKAEEGFDNLFIHLARYKFVARLVKKSDTVAEIGCGTGYGSRFLADFVSSVVAVDRNEDILEKAKNRYSSDSRITFAKELQEGSFYDAIVCLEVIEHLSVEGGKLLLEHIISHLSETGIAYISTPRKIPNPSLNRQKYHIHEYEFEEFRKTLELYFRRVLLFTQIDESIATYHPSCAWNFVAVCMK